MPCHVDVIPAKTGKQEVDMIVEVIEGKIKFKEIGDSFSGKYPTVTACVERFRKTNAKKRNEQSFQWATHGTMIVFVSPCPKGC